MIYEIHTRLYAKIEKTVILNSDFCHLVLKSCNIFMESLNKTSRVKKVQLVDKAFSDLFIAIDTSVS